LIGNHGRIGGPCGSHGHTPDANANANAHADQ